MEWAILLQIWSRWRMWDFLARESADRSQMQHSCLFVSTNFIIEKKKKTFTVVCLSHVCSCGNYVLMAADGVISTTTLALLNRLSNLDFSFQHVQTKWRRVFKCYSMLIPLSSNRWIALGEFLGPNKMCLYSNYLTKTDLGMWQIVYLKESIKKLYCLHHPLE